MSISQILQQSSFDIIGRWSKRYEPSWSAQQDIKNDAKFPDISQYSKYRTSVRGNLCLMF